MSESLKKGVLQSMMLGIGLTVLTNLVFTGNMFIVGVFKMAASELCFIKGIIQTVIFSLAVWPCRKSRKTKSKTEVRTTFSLWIPVIVVLYGFSNASATILAYIAVKLIPASFCFLMIAGVILISKPTFIFGGGGVDEDMSTETVDSFHLNVSRENLTEISHHNEENYGLGTVLILSCAAVTAVGSVTSAQSKSYDFPNVWLMVSAGVATLAASGIAPLINMQNRFFEGEGIWEIQFYPDVLLMIGTGLGSIAGGHMLIVANQKCPPTVVSIVRSSEILIALFVDRVILGVTGHGYYALFGSLMVLGSVCGMAAADWCEAKLPVEQNGHEVEQQDTDVETKFLPGTRIDEEKVHG